MTEISSSRPKASVRGRAPVPRRGGAGLLPLIFVGLILLGSVAVWPVLQSHLEQWHLAGIVSWLRPSGNNAANAPSEVAAVAADTAVPQTFGKADRAEAAIITLMSRLDALETRLALVEDKMRAGTGAAAGGAEVTKAVHDLDALRLEIGTLERTVVSVRRLTEQKGHSPLYLLALGHLRDAVDRGEPYMPELQSVLAMVGGAGSTSDTALMQRLELLHSFAEQGVATRMALAVRFPDLSQRALQSLVLQDQPALVAKAAQWASSIISIRRTDGDGDGALPGAVARAKQALAGGDMNAALQVLQPFVGQGGAELDSWMRALATRIAVDKAVSELVAGALAKTKAEE